MRNLRFGTFYDLKMSDGERRKTAKLLLALRAPCTNTLMSINDFQTTVDLTKRLGLSFALSVCTPSRCAHKKQANFF